MKDLLRRFPILVVMFRKAYIDDRGWVDAFRGYAPGCNDLPEAAAVTAALDAYRRVESVNPPVETDSPKNWDAWRAQLAIANKRIQEAEAALEKACKAYTRQVRAERNFQFIGVRANICPIFWMTMFALVTFFPLVIPIRGLARFLHRQATPFRRAFALAALALMLSFGTAYEHEYPGTAASVGSAIGSGTVSVFEFVFVDLPVGIFYKAPKMIVEVVKSEYAHHQVRRQNERVWVQERRLEDARRREMERMEAKRQQEWEREHPESARRYREAEAVQQASIREEQAEGERAARAWQRKQDAQASAALKQTLRDAAPWCIGLLVLFALVAFFGRILDLCLVFFVYLVFVKLGVKEGGMLDRALQACTRAVMGTIRGLGRAIRATGQAIVFPFKLAYALLMLVRAFASAKYERFCFRLDPPRPEVLGPPPQFYTRTSAVSATEQPA